MPSIQCRSLIIQGEDDEYGTLKQVDNIITQIGGQSSKFIIPKVKHTPHKETPELILLKSSEFINKLTKN